MIDNELLLAISGLLDTKLEPIKADIKQLKLDNENMIKPALNLVTENYLSTTSLKSNIENIENLKADVDILKKVVTEHSQKLQQIS